MPGRPDPNAITIVVLKVTGGEEAGASSLAPKVGPLGLSAKKIAQDLAKATKQYAGLTVTCKLIIQNRQAQIEIVHTASMCIMKAPRSITVNINARTNQGAKKESEIQGRRAKQRKIHVDRKKRDRQSKKNKAGTTCCIQQKPAVESQR
jgi:large subunit ribosomal protein L12e